MSGKKKLKVYAITIQGKKTYMVLDSCSSKRAADKCGIEEGDGFDFDFVLPASHEQKVAADVLEQLCEWDPLRTVLEKALLVAYELGQQHQTSKNKKDRKKL